MAATMPASGLAPVTPMHPHAGVGQLYTGLTASATITGGQVLAVSGSGTLAPAGALSTSVVGIAVDDAANGAPVSLFCAGGVWTGTASGSITAGAKLVTAANGQLQTIGANTFEKIVGTALDTVTTGQPVRWVPA
jgi:hypothetical protein